MGLGLLAYNDNVNFSVSNLTVTTNFRFDRILEAGTDYSTLYLGLISMPDRPAISTISQFLGWKLR